MASNLRAASRFAVGAAVRAAVIAALVFAGLGAVAYARYYATAVVLLGLAGVVTASLVRAVMAVDRLYADFVEALAAGAADRPTRQARRFPALAGALDRAADRLIRERQDHARRAHELEALLDTVSAALLVVEPDGRVLLANRAARALAGEAAPALRDLPAVGASAARRLMALPPGAREIVRLADEQRMLAGAAEFRGADRRLRRLISLQALSSELSAVETRAWQDLVRILAHEMMNSLTPILSLSETLRAVLGASEAERGATEDIASAVDVIARRSAGLMSFVDRYRRVAELPEPRPQPIRAAELLSNLERLSAALFQQGGIDYTGEVQPADLVILGDPDFLEQALINLLKNAAEAVSFTDAPCVELTCRADAQQVRIAVSDNGMGLPPVDPEKIFTPFFTTKPGGSGVGITLARQIAVAHGGELRAYRNASGGATFSLILPSAAAFPGLEGEQAQDVWPRQSP